MRLADYLKRHKITQAQFAETIGASQAAVARYAAGERIPRAAVVQRIAEATKGKVTANDFVAARLDPPAAAESEAAA